MEDSAPQHHDLVTYSAMEEKLNIWSHGSGFLLAVAALPLLVVKASTQGSAWHIVSWSIFGASMIVLYAASTLYHWSKKPKLRRRFRIFDHAAIYLLIAGTYTPFTLTTLNGTVGWVLFGITWGLALGGVVLKMFFTGRYDKLSTILYVAMGWMVIFAVKPMINNLDTVSLWYLLAGGISYTVGAVLYSLPNLRFNHAIFHVFVLGGTICHFFAVYLSLQS